MISADEIAQLINRDPEIMGGRPVFRGTRVPIEALLDWMGGGYSLDDFLDNFPSVSRKQAQDLLRLANEWVLSQPVPSHVA
jgi:uncharacterized protein (DUF433 family)